MESEIPFPLLNGMVVEILQQGVPTYYTIKGQGTPFELSQAYLLAPSSIPTASTLKNQSFTVNNQNAMKTNANELKVWVSWIDNLYLTVNWEINSRQLNLLNGVVNPLTYETSPYGSNVMPLGIINSPTANVTYTLSNSNSQLPIRGIFRVIMYYYSVEKIPKPPAGQPYTSLDYVIVGE